VSTLTAKYIRAVTRTLPPDRRDGIAESVERAVSMKVRSLRAGDPAMTPAEAEYAAVAALGDPARRAPRRPEDKHFLLAPRIFVRILVVVVLLAVVGVGISRLVIGLDTGQTRDQILGEMAWIMLRTAYRATFLLAVCWFCIEIIARTRQRNRSGDREWTPDDLPMVN
jgi:hypothetical protein